MTCENCGHSEDVVRRQRWWGGHAWVWCDECDDTQACPARLLNIRSGGDKEEFGVPA